MSGEYGQNDIATVNHTNIRSQGYETFPAQLN